jgi:aspartate carbamoyltransferase catalytic subunit
VQVFTIVRNWESIENFLGFGDFEHPTQALIDLYATWLTFGELKGVKLCIAGPHLRQSRQVHLKLNNSNVLSRASHSFAFAAAPFGVDITIASSSKGSFSRETIAELRKVSNRVREVYVESQEQFRELLLEQDMVYLPGSFDTRQSSVDEFLREIPIYYLDKEFVETVSQRFEPLSHLHLA